MGINMLVCEKKLNKQVKQRWLVFFLIITWVEGNGGGIKHIGGFFGTCIKYANLLLFLVFLSLDGIWHVVDISGHL